ncbi:Uncharacterised protein [Vibrio cholerae]|nr:Uncharacterised protein [Vibrio cholerae]
MAKSGHTGQRNNHITAQPLVGQRRAKIQHESLFWCQLAA